MRQLFLLLMFIQSALIVNAQEILDLDSLKDDFKIRLEYGDLHSFFYSNRIFKDEFVNLYWENDRHYEKIDKLSFFDSSVVDAICHYLDNEDVFDSSYDYLIRLSAHSSNSILQNKLLHLYNNETVRDSVKCHIKNNFASANIPFFKKQFLKDHKCRRRDDAFLLLTKMYDIENYCCNQEGLVLLSKFLTSEKCDSIVIMLESKLSFDLAQEVCVPFDTIPHIVYENGIAVDTIFEIVSKEDQDDFSLDDVVKQERSFMFANYFVYEKALSIIEASIENECFWSMFKLPIPSESRFWLDLYGSDEYDFESIKLKANRKRMSSWLRNNYGKYEIPLQLIIP